jgi:hypothetical protein
MWRIAVQALVLSFQKVLSTLVEKQSRAERVRMFTHLRLLPTIVKEYFERAAVIQHVVISDRDIHAQDSLKV